MDDSYDKYDREVGMTEMYKKNNSIMRTLVSKAKENK
jgi:hypothetical protein